MFGWNILMTWRSRPADVRRAGDPGGAARARSACARRRTPHRRAPGRDSSRLDWHRVWEGRWLLFTVMVIVAVVVASLFEIIPTFLIRSNVPTIASVKPYTPLELAGRDLYIREGCFNCHSQMIRPVPLRDRTVRRVLEARRVRVRPSVPVGIAAHRSRSRARGRQVPRPLARAPHGGPAVDHAPSRSCRRIRIPAHRRPRLRVDPAQGRRHGDARRAVRRAP